MSKAPFVSTLIALGLIPVAFLYIHSFVAAIKKWKYHSLTGFLAVAGDLIISIGYMLFRTFGGKMNGESIDLTGKILYYFIVHGIVSSLVLILELAVLILGIRQMVKKSHIKAHATLGRILFFVWWFSFLSGELFYIIKYVL